MIDLYHQKLVKIRKQDVRLQIGGVYTAEAPDEFPDWGILAGLIFLFPTNGQ